MEKLPRSGVGVLNIADIRPFSRGRSQGVRRILRPQRMSMSVAYQDETVRVQTKLIGKHWVTSVLAAIGVGLACGIDLKTCAQIVAPTDPVFGRYTVHPGTTARFCARFAQGALLDDRRRIDLRKERQRAVQDDHLRDDSDYPGAAGPRYRRVRGGRSRHLRRFACRTYRQAAARYWHGQTVWLSDHLPGEPVCR